MGPPRFHCVEWLPVVRSMIEKAHISKPTAAASGEMAQEDNEETDECKREHTCASAQIAEDPYAYREEWEDEDFLSGIAT